MIQLPDIRFQTAENSLERDVVLRESDYVQMIDRLIELESLLNGMSRNISPNPLLSEFQPPEPKFWGHG